MENSEDSGEDAGPYSSEPLTDDERLRKYYREREIIDKLFTFSAMSPVHRHYRY